jgi:hypothetical protein
MANAERWAAGVPVPGYAIDDQTAIKVGRRHSLSRVRGALEAVCRLIPNRWDRCSGDISEHSRSPGF